MVIETGELVLIECQTGADDFVVKYVNGYLDDKFGRELAPLQPGKWYDSLHFPPRDDYQTGYEKDPTPIYTEVFFERIDL